MPMNQSIETPAKLRLWKNSCLGRPKNPSAAALSGEQPFAPRRTRQVVVLADADPLGPPVVAATVGMDDWFLAVLERGACVGEHAVGQRRVRAGADRPGDRHAVVAVDDRRQVHLARRDPELGDVRDPQLVRVRGVEVPVHEIGRRAATGTRNPPSACAASNTPC